MQELLQEAETRFLFSCGYPSTLLHKKYCRYNTIRNQHPIVQILRLTNVLPQPANCINKFSTVNCLFAYLGGIISTWALCIILKPEVSLENVCPSTRCLKTGRRSEFTTISSLHSFNIAISLYNVFSNSRDSTGLSPF